MRQVGTGAHSQTKVVCTEKWFEYNWGRWEIGRPGCLMGAAKCYAHTRPILRFFLSRPTRAQRKTASGKAEAGFHCGCVSSALENTSDMSHSGICSEFRSNLMLFSGDFGPKWVLILISINHQFSWAKYINCFQRYRGWTEDGFRPRISVLDTTRTHTLRLKRRRRRNPFLRADIFYLGVDASFFLQLLLSASVPNTHSGFSSTKGKDVR